MQPENLVPQRFPGLLAAIRRKMDDAIRTPSPAFRISVFYGTACYLDALIIPKRVCFVNRKFANKQSGIEYCLHQYRSAYLQIFLNFIAGRSAHTAE